jgi:hypothetical protein
MSARHSAEIARRHLSYGVLNVAAGVFRPILLKRSSSEEVVAPYSSISPLRRSIGYRLGCIAAIVTIQQPFEQF